jgi:O-antigen ligase
MVLMQALALRPGFLHRFAMATFGIGLMTIPYLELTAYGSDLERARLEQSISIANPNELASWFGFCAVYFLVTTVETRRSSVRVAAGMIALGCLGVVGLTISRTALLAVVVAGVVALRRVLRAGFVPVLLFAVAAAVIAQTDALNRAIASYTARGLVDTGRVTVWPLALERFADAPLAGVGASRVATDVPGRVRPITPHNAFLFIAVGSGVVPLAFFIGYWWRAARSLRRVRHSDEPTARYIAPLLLYSFLSIQSGNLVFIAPWVLAVTAIAMSPSRPRPRVPSSDVMARSNVLRAAQMHRRQLRHPSHRV